MSDRSAPFGREAATGSLRTAADESHRDSFAWRRLAVGTAGLACLTPYFAWRTTSSPLDLLLALSLVSPLAVAFVATRYGRLDWAHAISASGSAGLVACLFAVMGPSAWPGALWLIAEPLNALAAGSKRYARITALVSLTALALIVSAMVSGTLPSGEASAGALAACFLIGGALFEVAAGLGWTNGASRAATARVEPAPDPAARALEAAGLVMTWHDSRGDLVDVAGAALALTGRGPAALVHDGMLRQVHVPDRPVYLKAISDAFNGAEPVTIEFRIMRDGRTSPSASELRWIEIRAERERMTGLVVAILRDASTARIRDAELEAARAETVRANEMKGRFLATVSHELRTPLNAIIGFSELLGGGHPYEITAERRSEYAGIIRDSGNHLLEVVNALLDVSKIESGNFAFVAEPFSLPGLIDGCCDLMRLRAEECRITLDRRIATDLPDLVGDRRACRQILINLLSNAIKFSPASGTVTVSAAQDFDAIVLTVADQGIGIRAGDLPRLGEPFFQAGDVHRRAHEGTGLGLSIVRGLVGLHRGTMEVESGLDLGTAVRLSFPIRRLTEADDLVPVAVRTIVRRGRADGGDCDQERKCA